MASYHLHITNVSRGKGGNAVHSAAYYRGAQMFCERTGQTRNYSYKHEVVYSELSIPTDAPKWVKQLVQAEQFEKHSGSELLWNKVEQCEKRKDSRLAKVADYALPNELNLEQSKALARRFVETYFCQKGMIVDWSIHWKPGNHHVHVMMSTRVLTEHGFGLKETDWNKISLVTDARQGWEVEQNKDLAKYGFDERVSCRSYADRGIDLVPGVHRGPTEPMERRGIQTRKHLENEAICQENYGQIEREPEVLLKKMGLEQTSFTGQQIVEEMFKYAPSRLPIPDDKEGVFQSLEPFKVQSLLKDITDKAVVFSDWDVARAVNVTTQDRERFLQVLAQIKGSKELIFLGPGDDGRDRYTTKACFERESGMQDQVDVLSKRHGHFVKETILTQVVSEFEQKQREKNPDFTLSYEQKSAISHVLKSGDVSVLVGRAGTGKTTVLEPCALALEKAGYSVRGLALPGMAVQNLKSSIGKNCETIAAFTTRLDKGFGNVTSRDVLLVDEASVVGSEDMAKIISSVKAVGAKVVLIGDDGQLYGVKGGAPFRAITERVGFAELREVHRQKTDWGREASQSFARGDVLSGLKAYEEKGCVHFCKDDKSAQSLLVKDWLNNTAQVSHKLILAHRRTDVAALNKLVRARRLEAGQLKQSHIVSLKFGALPVAVGERVRFAEKALIGKHRIERNQFASVEHIRLNKQGKLHSVTLALDKATESLTLSATTLKGIQLKYGYACTVHKAQGSTIAHVYTYLSGYWDRALTYVASTRHKLSYHIYVNQSEHKDLDSLARQCGLQPIKDSVLDFPLHFSMRRGFDIDQLTGFKKHVANTFVDGSQKLRDAFESALFPERFKTRQAEAQRLAVQQAGQDKVHTSRMMQRRSAVLVAKWEDAHRLSGKTWGELRDRAFKLGQWDFDSDQPLLTSLKNTSLYREARAATETRNALASKLLEQSHVYLPILKNLGKDAALLQTQKTAHTLFEHIQVYKQHSNQPKGFEAGYRIQQLMEKHTSLYPQLLSSGIAWKDLRQASVSHQRREALNTLKGDALIAFKRADGYATLNEQSRTLWKTITAHKSYRAGEPSTFVFNGDALDVTKTRRQSPSLTALPSQAMKPHAMNAAFNPALTVARQPSAQLPVPLSREHWHSQPFVQGNHKYAATEDNILQTLNEERKTINLKRNELADAIWKNLPVHHMGLKLFGIMDEAKEKRLTEKLSGVDLTDKQKIGITATLGVLESAKQRLQQQHHSHQFIKAIQTYKQHPDQLKGFEAAFHIQGLMAEHRYLYPEWKNANLDNKTLRQSVLQHQRHELLQSLKGELLDNFKRVDGYVQLGRQASTLWIERQQRSRSLDALKPYALPHLQAKNTLVAPKTNLSKTLSGILATTSNQDVSTHFKFPLKGGQTNQTPSNKPSTEMIHIPSPVHPLQTMAFVPKGCDNWEILKAQQLKSKLKQLEDAHGAITGERNESAAKIHENPDAHAAGLALFSIVDKAKQSELSEKIGDNTLSDKQKIGLGKYLQVFEQKEATLKNHAHQHVCFERVQQYKAVLETHDLIQAQNLASTMRKSFTQDYGLYYRLAKAGDVHWNNLQLNAETHDKEKIYISLSEPEKKAFDVVSHYVKHEREFKDTADTLNYEDKAKIFYQRNCHASAILKDKAVHQSGLDFYHIKLSDNPSLQDKSAMLDEFDKSLSLEDRNVLKSEHRALKSGARLQTQAKQFDETKSLLRDYQIAGASETKQSLAHQLQAKPLMTKGHLIETANFDANQKSSLSFELYFNAMQYTLNRALEKARDKEKPLLNRVIDYRQAAFNTSNAWKTYFQAKDNSFTALHALKETALTHQSKRDTLAFDIHQQRESHQKQLTLAHIKIEPLMKQAASHEKILASMTPYLTDRQGHQNRLMQLQENSGESLFQSEDFMQWRKAWESQLQKGQSLLRTHPTLAYQDFYATHQQDKDFTRQLDTLAGIEVRTKAILPSQYKNTYQGQLSLGDIQERLKDKVAPLTTLLLGEPNPVLSNTNILAFGQNGSLKVHISGEKAGLWYDFEQGQGGNLFALIEHKTGCDFKTALGQAKDFLGLNQEAPHPVRQTDKTVEIRLRTPMTPESLPTHKINYALQLAGNTKPLSGTQAERYLEKRGVDTSNVTRNLGFGLVYESESQKKLPALIAIARDKNENSQAIQTIFLDGNRKASVNIPKRTHGMLKGSGVLVQAGRREVIALAEGVETALSVAQSNRNLTVYATLGSSNLANLQLAESDKGTPILLCADNDGVHAASNKMIDKAVNAWNIKGHDVYLAKPDTIKGQGKCDFNDTLQHEKIGAVKTQIQKAPLVQKALTQSSLIQQWASPEKSLTIDKPTTLSPLFHQLEKQTLVTERTHQALKDLNWQETTQYILENHTTHKNLASADFEAQYLAEKISDAMQVLRKQHRIEPTVQDIDRLVSKVTCELQAMKIYTKQVATKHPHDIPEPAWDNTLKQAERIAGIVGRQAEAHLKEQGDTPSLAHLSKWVVEAQAEINRHQAQINSPVSFRDREAEHKHLFEERYGMEAKGAMCQSINKKAARQDYLTSFYMDSQGLSPDRSYWIAFNEAEAGSRLDNTSGVIDRRQCEQGRKQYYDNMECILQVWAKEHQRDLQKERQAHHSEREREHQQTELQRTLEQDKNRDRGFER